MSYLLDTCVLSEFTKKTPNKRVLAWLNNLRDEDLFLSAIVLGELSRGVSRLKESSKKRKLHAWLHGELSQRLKGRVLAVDDKVALEWGRISGRAEQEGRAISMADGLIAATAGVHSLVLVTRNVKDFNMTGLVVFNPWVDV